MNIHVRMKTKTGIIDIPSNNKKENKMTPSQEINDIANELMKLNKRLSLQKALTNAIITYLDRKEIRDES